MCGRHTSSTGETSVLKLEERLAVVKLYGELSAYRPDVADVKAVTALTARIQTKNPNSGKYQ